MELEDIEATAERLRKKAQNADDIVEELDAPFSAPDLAAGLRERARALDRVAERAREEDWEQTEIEYAFEKAVPARMRPLIDEEDEG